MIETELSRHGYWFVFVATVIEGDATLLTAAFLASVRRLRLPAGYVKRVLEARGEGLISNRKAAEMVMMAFDVFKHRFPIGEQALDVA